jgi:uncharacterized protein
MEEFQIHNVPFESEGLQCFGELYLPRNSQKKFPCVVLVTGFTGTSDWILPDFAKRFAEAGFAAYIFDYRYFGKSEGEPRYIVNLKKQRTDLQNALKMIRKHESIDVKKIILWGTSLGGSHAVQAASQDADIAAVIGNVPGIDVIKGANTMAKAKAANASKWDIFVASVKLLVAILSDIIRNFFGLSPRYLKVYGKAGEAVITDLAQAERFKLVEAKSTLWKNKVAARSLLQLPIYKEGTIERIKSPIFVAIATKDIEANPEYLKAKFSKASNVEIREYPCDHFSLYHGKGFEEAVEDQISFLKKYF